MVLLYNIGVGFYILVALIISPFNRKAALWVKGRRGQFAKLRDRVNPTHRNAWFHCASLGEFEQGRPLIEAYREQYPSHRIVVTFFSPSGYEVRKGYQGADYVCYLPVDTHWNAKRFLDLVNPVVAVFVKYEFWYHFLTQLRRRRIPTFAVSSIFRPNQLFFRWYGAWYRSFLHAFRHIFVQNAESLELLRGIGFSNVTVVGDTRFDRVYATGQRAKSIEAIERFAQGARVLVAGSTWPADEGLLADLLDHTPLDLKLVIAPHEPNDTDIRDFQRALRAPSVRHSQSPSPDELAGARVYILDTIGLLSSAYRYAAIAYVGGGFGAGIHNTLEPATFGVPVLFGPNYERFNEAVKLVELGAGSAIASAQELADTVNRLLASPQELSQWGQAAKGYVQSNIGVTRRVLDAIGSATT